MEKKLLKQMKNEWRSNLWLALELLVVSVVMWYIIDLLYSPSLPTWSLVDSTRSTATWCRWKC